MLQKRIQFTSGQVHTATSLNYFRDDLKIVVVKTLKGWVRCLQKIIEACSDSKSYENAILLSRRMYTRYASYAMSDDHETNLTTKL